MTLDADVLYVQDLRDDFIMNYDRKLYDFLENDPLKAFYLGIYVNKWFESLNRDQQYLHSKSLRHVQRDISQYIDQIQYFADKYQEIDDNEDINSIHLSNYVFDNIIWFNEDEDRVKVALFLGLIVGKNSNIKEENLSYNVTSSESNKENVVEDEE